MIQTNPLSKQFQSPINFRTGRVLCMLLHFLVIWRWSKNFSEQVPRLTSRTRFVRSSDVFFLWNLPLYWHPSFQDLIKYHPGWAFSHGTSKTSFIRARRIVPGRLRFQQCTVNVHQNTHFHPSVSFSLTFRSPRQHNLRSFVWNKMGWKA